MHPASVQIEGDDGSIYTLSETSPGTYTLVAQVLDATLHFRLKIKTADQNQYVSDFVPVKEAPVIDTIRNTLQGEDLQIYLSTHDENENTRYYLWKYIETWAYDSRYPSEYIFDNGIVTRRPSPFDIYHCWMTVNSSQILVGSTAKLEQDIISDYPLILLNLHSERLQ